MITSPYTKDSLNLRNALHGHPCVAGYSPNLLHANGMLMTCPEIQTDY